MTSYVHTHDEHCMYLILLWLEPPGPGWVEPDRIEKCQTDNREKNWAAAERLANGSRYKYIELREWDFDLGRYSKLVGQWPE